jgi:L-threonylcarbamoyladenylate synthase
MEKEVRELILSGIPFIFPTETVLGVGVVWKYGLDQLYQLKKRERGKPISLHLTMDIDWEKFIVVEKKWLCERIKKLLPGPYTFIFAKNPGKLPDSLFPFEKVGLRFPKNKYFAHIIESLHEPVWGTSVNLSGERDSLTLEDIPTEIKEKVLILENIDYKVEAGEPSTVVDLSQWPHKNKMVLRKGAGDLNKLWEALGDEV